jgi:thymidylate kinase
MIIELFGPPGAGKTTFARALAASLRRNGQTVDLMLSYRPAELSPATDVHAHRVSSVLRRLARPLAETLTMTRHPITSAQHLSSAWDLIKIIPPSHILWRLRLAQYLLRLSRAWFQASEAEHVVLFDQAFVQAVCSLALLCGSANVRSISQALDKIPKSDLLIMLQAPVDILEARLCERQSHESRMERLLELDLATSLKSSVIINNLLELLPSKGRQISIVTSLDRVSLEDGLTRIEKKIAAQFGSKKRPTTDENPAGLESSSADRHLAAPRRPLVEEG